MNIKAIIAMKTRFNACQGAVCAKQFLQNGVAFVLFLWCGLVVFPAKLLRAGLCICGNIFITARIGSAAFHYINRVHIFYSLDLVHSKYYYSDILIETKNANPLQDWRFTLVLTTFVWSEWRESNSRPLEPHSSALPNCATPGRTRLSRISLFIIAECAGNVNAFFQKNQIFSWIF